MDENMITLESKIDQHARKFRKFKYLKLTNFFSEERFEILYDECMRLLNDHSKRKDFLMEETNSTPRKITTVSGKVIHDQSNIIKDLYRDSSLIEFLERVSNEKLYITPDIADRHAIHRLHKKGDEHGGHVDTYPYVFIIFLEHPDINEGGELEFVPDSINISDLNSEKVIRDSFKSGECYFMKAGVNVHCVKPLKVDSNRTVLVLTYANIDSKNITLSYSSNKLYD